MEDRTLFSIFEELDLELDAVFWQGLKLFLNEDISYRRFLTDAKLVATVCIAVISYSIFYSVTELLKQLMQNLFFLALAILLAHWKLVGALWTPLRFFFSSKPLPLIKEDDGIVPAFVAVGRKMITPMPTNSKMIAQEFYLPFVELTIFTLTIVLQLIRTALMPLNSNAVIAGIVFQAAVWQLTTLLPRVLFASMVHGCSWVNECCVEPIFECSEKISNTVFNDNTTDDFSSGDTRGNKAMLSRNTSFSRRFAPL